MADESMRERPGVGISLIPAAALMLFLFVGIRYLGTQAHLPLILGSVVAALAGKRLGFGWPELQRSMVKGIGIAMPSVLILMAIGLLIGAWIAAGIVPYLIYLGLKILSPQIFLAASCAICAVVSLATGSSWSTAGTVGVALIGAGQGLGVPLPMVAGAIISGAYFGDKLSPLSDTTNLAPAVAGSELFEHIRHMLYTTAPSFLIALALFVALGLGLERSGEADLARVEGLSAALANRFSLTPWLLAAPALLVGLVMRRVPALPAILAGAALGVVLGIVFQGASAASLFESLYSGYISDTGTASVDELLSRGGLESMYSTIGLILCSMAFGGLMEGTGMLGTLASSMLKYASSAGSLTATTLVTCFGVNVLAADQYLSIIVPGRMYREAYRKAGLKARNLSRCLEDGGTITSPLVPWNSCGIFMAGVLTVSPMAYLPYAFFNLVNPLMSAFIGAMGWTMDRTDGAACLDDDDQIRKS